MQVDYCFVFFLYEPFPSLLQHTDLKCGSVDVDGLCDFLNFVSVLCNIVSRRKKIAKSGKKKTDVRWKWNGKRRKKIERLSGVALFCTFCI